MEATNPVPGGENKLHFLDYWRVIRIRKLVILSVFLLVVTTTTLVSLWMPKKYASKVSLTVQKDLADIQPLMGDRQNNGSFDPYFIQDQLERIQSKDVLYKVIDEMQLSAKWAQRYGYPTALRKDETLVLLDKRMDARNVRNTSYIEVKVYDEDPQEAADIANKIAITYRDNRLAQRDESNTNSISEMKAELDEKTRLISEKGLEVEKLRKDLEITDILAEGGEQTSIVEQETIRRMEASRIEANSAYETARQKWESLTNKPIEQLPAAIALTMRDENLTLLIGKRITAAQELTRTLNDVTEEHPDAKKIKELLKTVDTQITNYVAAVMGTVQDQMKASQETLQRVTSQVEDAKRKAREATARARPYFQVKQELEYLKAMQKALSMKLQAVSIDTRMPMTSIVKITGLAEPSIKPALPNLPLNIALSIIVGLMAGIGLAFFIEYLDTSVKTIDEIEQSLQAPVLGVIPQNVGSLLKEGLDSPHAEAYRVLRTQILFSRKDATKNCLSVVSGGAGEGKSTTIFNLATIFAQNGARVLLVDSDLRRPSIHKILDVDNSPGFTDHLLGKSALEDVVQTTPQENLYFLPSGRLPSSALGILNSPHMREFVEKIRKDYDFVFFDSPPIMGVSDASILTSLMDYTLLVVQHRKYPQAMTVRAKQTVDKVGGTLLGVVLNNINIAQDSYYYYYSGFYYDAYSNLNKDDDDPSAGGTRKRKKKSTGTPSKTEEARPELALKQKY